MCAGRDKKKGGIWSSKVHVEPSQDWLNPHVYAGVIKTVLSMRERQHEKRKRRTWGAVHDVGIDTDDNKINNERNGKGKQ
jgi:hypothetical protein